MAVNEIELSAVNKTCVLNNRVLGMLGIIGAPMLFIEMLTRALMNLPDKLNEQFVGFLGVFYIGGWIAATIGMRRFRATGTGLASKVVLIIQMIGLISAFLFSARQLLGIAGKRDSLFFIVTDTAYPFSHVFMLIVGILVWRAHVLKGFARIAPFFVMLMLPLFLIFSAFINNAFTSIIPSGLAAIGFLILSFAVFQRD